MIDAKTFDLKRQRRRLPRPKAERSMQTKVVALAVRLYRFARNAMPVKGGRSRPRRRRLSVEIELANQPSESEPTVALNGNGRMRPAGRQYDKAIAGNCLSRLLASVPGLGGKLQQAQVMRF